MRTLSNFDNKVMHFACALKDMHRDGEERESIDLPKLELKESELTEDFTAMIYAIRLLYIQITGDEETDAIGFTHLCNRLVFQHIDENHKQEGEQWND